jgi:RNA polymerase sigma factor (sigma-70 family)
MNDCELLSAFGRGDDSALDSLIKKYLPTVYAAAVRQLGDHHLAEDVAQSVFILFSRKAAHLPRGVLLGGWFLRTTRFVCRDVFKQMKRRSQREQRAAQLAETTEREEPAWAALVPFVDDALGGLSRKEQACVIARFLEGRSLRDIGVQQGISEDAAQKRVSRGLEKMRVFLQRRGVKIGAVGLAAMLSTELARAADSRLVESAIAGIHSAMQGKALSAASVQFANAAARKLFLRSFLQIAGSCVLSGTFLFTGFATWRDHAVPALPAAAPFRPGNPAIDALASDWGRLDIRAATLVRAGNPAPNDPRFPAFQAQILSSSREGDRILAAFRAGSPAGSSPSQLAEFLTLELRETVGLNPRQEAVIFNLLRAELERGGGATAGRQTLLREKSQVGRQIRSWLSRRQQRRFDFTYREDFLGLFTFVEIQ